MATLDKEHIDKLKTQIDNQFTKLAFEKLKKSVFDKWAKAQDPQERETLWIKYQIIQEFEQAFKGIVNAGALKKSE